jgi:hypothetical protein
MREPKVALTLSRYAGSVGRRHVRASGFYPVKVGGIEAAERIELGGGDPHQHGGLGGRLLTIDEARAAVWRWADRIAGAATLVFDGDGAAVD